MLTNQLDQEIGDLNFSINNIVKHRLSWKLWSIISRY